MFQCGTLRQYRFYDCRELRLKQNRSRVGMAQDIGQPGRVQHEVQRRQNKSALGRAEQGLDVNVAVPGKHRDPVTRHQTEPCQRMNQPIGPQVQPTIGDAAAIEDRRGLVRESPGVFLDDLVKGTKGWPGSCSHREISTRSGESDRTLNDPGRVNAVAIPGMTVPFYKNEGPTAVGPRIPAFLNQYRKTASTKLDTHIDTRTHQCAQFACPVDDLLERVRHADLVDLYAILG